MEELMKSAFPGKPITVSLDRLIASVQASQEKAKPVSIKTDPPPIFVSTEPAILLPVPDKPALAPIKGVDLKFVLNTSWDLFFAPTESRYYLLNGDPQFAPIEGTSLSYATNTNAVVIKVTGVQDKVSKKMIG
jgi:hypothetical protein